MTAEERALLAMANDLADASRKTLLDAAGSEPAVRLKADSSFVTETDRAIEARLRDMIDARFPGHGVIGEELGSRNAESEHVWILDPIDGTAPFIAGLPVYGTLIGLARGGRPYLGVIDHPATGDRWVGVIGAGTWRNAAPQRTRRCSGLDVAFATNSNPDFMDDGERARFDRLRARVRYVQYGGSCFAYGLLASGRTDIAIDAGLETCDIFAPTAIIEAAGGTVTDWDGADIDLGWRGRVLAAGDRRLHEEALQVLEQRPASPSMRDDFESAPDTIRSESRGGATQGPKMSTRDIDAASRGGEGDTAARLVVDRAALADNYRAIASPAAAEAAGVVKADGYGLGAPEVARTLHAAGCRTFFAGFTQEAVELRQVLRDEEIFVLMPSVGDEAHVLQEHRLIPCLFDLEGVDRWIGRTSAHGAPARAALHVETGIHRLGLVGEELDTLLADDARRSRLEVTLLMSHLACADEPPAPANRLQLDRFRAIRERFPNVRASFANSAGTFLGSDYHFDLVRPGIALYGHDPHYLHTAPRVRPVATLEARLGQIATVRPGESVGYGATATCDVARRIGVVLAGYADGVPRTLYRPGRRFDVMIAGYRVPLFGRVSMDMITVDLSGVPEDAVQAGMWVEIFGRNVAVERVAEQSATIPNDILTGIGQRVERIYV